MIKHLLPLAAISSLVFSEDCRPDLFQPAYPSIDCCENSCRPESCSVNALVEMRAAYLHPTGSHFDDIYGGSGIYNFELSIQTWFDLYTWFSLGYLRNSGQSLGLNNRTLFQMVPLGFGLKYLLNCSCLRPYLGAGLGMTWIDVDNYREFVKKEINKWGVGSVFKAGSLWYMSSCCFLDFFIDYTYMDIGFSDTSIDPFALSNDADISGFSFGFGLGYSF